MTKTTAQAPATGRSTVTRITDTRRRPQISRVRDARRQIRSREERFAHLKRMYD